MGGESAKGGTGALGIVQIVFFILKICNVHPIGDWPWWKVLLPFECSIALICFLSCCIGCVGIWTAKDDAVSTPGSDLTYEQRLMLENLATNSRTGAAEEGSRYRTLEPEIAGTTHEPALRWADEEAKKTADKTRALEEAASVMWDAKPNPPPPIAVAVPVDASSPDSTATTVAASHSAINVSSLNTADFDIIEEDTEEGSDKGLEELEEGLKEQN